MSGAIGLALLVAGWTFLGLSVRWLDRRRAGRRPIARWWRRLLHRPERLSAFVLEDVRSRVMADVGQRTWR